jgi:hypothetical protein
MAMTEKQRLEIYDLLRDAHRLVYEAWKLHKDDINSAQDNAIDAVSSVLYLAEGVFASE